MMANVKRCQRAMRMRLDLPMPHAAREKDSRAKLLDVVR